MTEGRTAGAILRDRPFDLRKILKRGTRETIGRGDDGKMTERRRNDGGRGRRGEGGT